MRIYLIGSSEQWDSCLLPLYEHKNVVCVNPKGETEPEGTSWNAFKFSEQGPRLLKELLEKQDDPEDDTPRNTLSMLLNQLDILGKQEDRELSVEIHTIDKATEPLRKLDRLTLIVKGRLLKNIHSLIHQGDQHENLRIIFKAVIPNYHGYKHSFVSSAFVPKSTSRRSTNDHSIYMDLNQVKVQVHGKSIPPRDDYPSPGNFIFMRILLELDVSFEDYLPLNNPFDDMYYFSRKTFYSNGSGDLTVVVNDGTHATCHKNVLLMYCAELTEKMIAGNKKLGRLEMKDLSRPGMEALLQFIYFRSMTVPKANRKVALELFMAGHKYKIEKLLDAVETLFLVKRKSWFDARMAEKIMLATTTLKTLQGEDVKRKMIQILAVKRNKLLL